MTKTISDIRKDNLIKNQPNLMSRISQAVERQKLGNPTVDDYRLIMEYPRIVRLFLTKSHEV